MAKNHAKSHAIVFFGAVSRRRATIVSDIIVRMVADDGMSPAPIHTQRMSAYSVSAFLAETLFLVKTPPTTTKLGSGLPSSHGGHL